MPVPNRRKAPREVRAIDTTSCRANTYLNFVHRDYVAHCFRWSWAARLIGPGQKVLDVGCGVEAMLARVLSGTNFVHGGQYVGVDMNRLTRVMKKPWATYHGEFDFVQRYATDLTPGTYDVVVNFEVIEHVTVELGARMLAAMREMLRPGGVLYLSTPVFNGKAAQNHVHEYTVPELQAAIEAAGLRVERRLGTFASYPVLKKALTPEHRTVLEQLREFHGDDLMATWLAPLYPDHSRNCFWVLKRDDAPNAPPVGDGRVRLKSTPRWMEEDGSRA